MDTLYGNSDMLVCTPCIQSCTGSYLAHKDNSVGMSAYAHMRVFSVGGKIKLFSEPKDRTKLHILAPQVISRDDSLKRHVIFYQPITNRVAMDEEGVVYIDA